MLKAFYLHVCQTWSSFSKFSSYIAQSANITSAHELILHQRAILCVLFFLALFNTYRKNSVSHSRATRSFACHGNKISVALCIIISALHSVYFSFVKLRHYTLSISRSWNFGIALCPFGIALCPFRICGVEYVSLRRITQLKQYPFAERLYPWGGD